MRYYSKRFTVYYFPRLQYQCCTHCTPSWLWLGTTWEEHTIPNQVTNKVCILSGTHIYIWVEISNVDKVSYWRTKVPGNGGIEPGPSSRLVSNLHTNILWHLHYFTSLISLNIVFTFPRTSHMMIVQAMTKQSDGLVSCQGLNPDIY